MQSLAVVCQITALLQSVTIRTTEITDLAIGFLNASHIYELIHSLPGSPPVVTHARHPGSPRAHSDSQLSQTHRRLTRGSSSPATLSPGHSGAWTPKEAMKEMLKETHKTNSNQWEIEDLENYSHTWTFSGGGGAPLDGFRSERGSAKVPLLLAAA